MKSLNFIGIVRKIAQRVSIFTNSTYIPNGGIAYNYPITAKPITKVSSSNITTEVVGNFTFPTISFWEKNKDNFLFAEFSYIVRNFYGQQAWEQNNLNCKAYVNSYQIDQITSSTVEIKTLLSFNGTSVSGYYSNSTNKYRAFQSTGLGQLWIKKDGAEKNGENTCTLLTPASIYVGANFTSSEMDSLYTEFLNGTYNATLTIYLKNEVIE